MSLRNDPDYLRNYQYRTDKNLQARISLHKKYSTNPVDWNDWVQSHILAITARNILEVGGGPGSLWRDWDAGALSHPPKVFLNDFSLGMLKSARQVDPDGKFLLLACNDVQFLPFTGNSVDLVIANHMLYHVPDISLALCEIQRVLKADGTFLTATNGHTHMQEVDELVRQAAPDLPNLYHVSRNFNLENAMEFLTPFFTHVHLEYYEDSLVIDRAEPLLDYIVSIWEKFIDLDQKASILAAIESRLAQEGKIHIQKSTGMFVCKNHRT